MPTKLRLPAAPSLNTAHLPCPHTGFDPWRLAEAGRLARAHMARLESEAAGIAGKQFNLASPSQLAEVLYTVLKASRSGEGLRSLSSRLTRGAIRIQGPTQTTAVRCDTVQEKHETYVVCLIPTLHRPAPNLQLPPPTAHGRAAAKTHLPTDEAALKQLQRLSPLPGLVIQHRALQVGGLGNLMEGSWDAGGAEGQGV